MKLLLLGLFILIMGVQSSYAQPTETIKTVTNKTPEQQEVIHLSQKKWNWMAEKM